MQLTFQVWSPGQAVADFDGDGHQDLFLAQSFFGTDLASSRCDAGRGLWLRGDGKGDFRAIAGQESGVTLYGDQRAAATADYDRDGRIDLAVGQNRGTTALFHDRRARPGLRVLLRGSPANPNAVGAALRLEFAGNLGPLCELRAGSGYWSQDSFTQVLAQPQPATGLWVRWPGGRITTHRIPAATRELVVSADAVEPLPSAPYSVPSVQTRRPADPPTCRPAFRVCILVALH